MKRPELPALLFCAQIPFRIECGHASTAGGGDRLAVTKIMHVARGKDSFDRCFCLIMHFNPSTSIIQIETI
jgi:hypothetical protein